MRLFKFLSWFLLSLVTAVNAEDASYDMDKGTLFIPFVNLIYGGGERSLGPYQAKLQHIPTNTTYDFTLSELHELPAKSSDNDIQCEEKSASASTEIPPQAINNTPEPTPVEPLTETHQRLQGHDNNSSLNTFIQSENRVETGRGRSQSMNAGDVIIGGNGNDVLIGGLGIDVLLGYGGHDVLIGGTEDFFSHNQDRVLGGAGNDVLLWSYGDGNDYFHGGSGDFDVVIMGLIGETEEDSEEVLFEASSDQNADPIFMDSKTRLPVIDVSNSVGFCEIVDDKKNLQPLQLDHLIRYKARDIAESYREGEQKKDNGLRATLHLKDVEYLVCNDKEGENIQVFNLQKHPATVVELDILPSHIVKMIR